MENSKIICPLCEEGHLTVYQKENTDTVHGVIFNFLSTSAVCDHCESPIATADMIDANADAYNQAREAVEAKIDAAFDEERRLAGLLTSHEIRQLRSKMKLTQIEASQVFGGGIRAFSKYETCQTMQSEAMDKLIRLASEVPEAMEWLCEKANIEYKIKLTTKPASHYETSKFFSSFISDAHIKDFTSEIGDYVTTYTKESNEAQVLIKIDNMRTCTKLKNQNKQNEKQGRDKFSLLGHIRDNFNSLIYS